MPRLILLALQVNLMAGRLPAPDAQGRRILRHPLNALQRARPEEAPSGDAGQMLTEKRFPDGPNNRA